MGRRPNYRFERMERDRAKVAKKAARLKAKQEKTEARKGEDGEIVLGGVDAGAEVPAPVGDADDPALGGDDGQQAG